tara:strand:+ start:425 stop:1669 length:1245 start_codon:yes stop_codon:yes gene_type:complete
MDKNYYLEFENKFRGDRGYIVDKLASYDKLLELVLINEEIPRIIDIGCGRGEFLERWKEKIPNSYGIEADPRMAEFCRNKGLNIIEGDAISSLANISSNSISIITIFHVVEHLKSEQLKSLLSECYRVLHTSGILIIETPSIDNLIVSTNTFYIDDTHIKHINPDAFNFLMEYIGFKNIQHFYINPGPLKDASHAKLTRVFNGIAQDVMFLATKNNYLADQIFKLNDSWKSTIDLGLTTLEAAIQFDLKNEKSIHEISRRLSILEDKSFSEERIKLLDSVNYEINLLKTNLRYILFILKIINNFLKFFISKFLSLKNKIVYFMTIVFNKLIKIKFFRSTITSYLGSRLLHLVIYIIFSDKSKFYLEKIIRKLKKYDLYNFEDEYTNNYLLNHYTKSTSAKEIHKSLNEYSKRGK